MPAEEVIYVAPAMIAHYMRDHDYRPPEAFCTAVLACPDPATDAYYAALKVFREVFSRPGSSPMSEADFDRYAREHREHVMEARRTAATRASRKGFTWD